VNLAQQPEKIDLLQQQVQFYPHYAMQLVRAHSYIDDKVMYVFVLQLQSACQDFAILFLLVQR
jgi:hypothetical protein